MFVIPSADSVGDHTPSAAVHDDGRDLPILVRGVTPDRGSYTHLTVGQRDVLACARTQHEPISHSSAWVMEA